MHDVYILKSSKLNRYYVGSTSNIEARIKWHNAGRVKYTSRGLPWVLMRFIVCDSLTVARQSEYRLKKYKRRDILEKVIADGKFPWNYS